MGVMDFPVTQHGGVRNSGFLLDAKYVQDHVCSEEGGVRGMVLLSCSYLGWEMCGESGGFSLLMSEPASAHTCPHTCVPAQTWPLGLKGQVE